MNYDNPTRVPLQGPAILPTGAELEAAVERAVRAIRLAATPSTTWNVYARALRYWCAWVQLRYGAPLAVPTPVAVVQQFVLDHFGEPVPSPDPRRRLSLRASMPPAVDAALVATGFKAAPGRQKITTIDHRVAILSWAHREKKLDSPCQDPAVRRLLSDCRKLARELGEGARTKTAATQEVLDAMLATCDDSLEGLRDRALLLFGWSSGGRRRSEIAHADVGDIEWLNEGAGVFRMRHSKTGDTGPKPVTGEAAAALQAWLRQALITSGPLFRRVWGPRVGGGLSPHAIGAIVKRRAALAGLKGDFAGHSLRRGFVTEAGLNDVPLAQTMAMTGHRLAKSVIRYHEVGDVLSHKASQLLTLGRAKPRRARRLTDDPLP